jgi:hypothetical protein
VQRSRGAACGARVAVVPHVHGCVGGACGCTWVVAATALSCFVVNRAAVLHRLLSDWVGGLAVAGAAALHVRVASPAHALCMGMVKLRTSVLCALVLLRRCSHLALNAIHRFSTAVEGCQQPARTLRQRVVCTGACSLLAAGCSRPSCRAGWCVMCCYQYSHRCWTLLLIKRTAQHVESRVLACTFIASGSDVGGWHFQLATSWVSAVVARINMESS